MRPSFRGFLRLACRPVARLGAGVGGALLATTLRLRDGRLRDGLDLPDAVGFLRGALAIPAITGAQLAVVASDIPPAPFTIGGEMPDYPRDAVLVLDGYGREALAAASAAVARWLDASPLAGVETAWTSYLLGYIVGADDLPQVVSISQRSIP